MRKGRESHVWLELRNYTDVYGLCLDNLKDIHRTYPLPPESGWAPETSPSLSAQHFHSEIHTNTWSIPSSRVIHLLTFQLIIAVNWSTQWQHGTEPYLKFIPLYATYVYYINYTTLHPTAVVWLYKFSADTLQSFSCVFKNFCSFFLYIKFSNSNMHHYGQEESLTAVKKMKLVYSTLKTHYAFS